MALSTMALALACVGCSSDGGDSSQATDADSAGKENTAGPPKPETTPQSTITPTTAAGTAATTTPSGGGVKSFTCPDATAASAALGHDVVVDSEAPVSASGFCPYTSSDGSGNPAVSITFTPLHVTDDPDLANTSEQLSGVGEAAYWNDSIGELTMWTGTYGVIVDVLTFGTELASADHQAMAVALAKLAS